MNIGVLGTKFGAYHAELWSRMEGVEQVTVYGRNEEKLGLLQKKLGVQVTSRIEDMIGARVRTWSTSACRRLCMPNIRRPPCERARPFCAKRPSV